MTAAALRSPSFIRGPLPRHERRLLRLPAALLPARDAGDLGIGLALQLRREAIRTGPRSDGPRDLGSATGPSASALSLRSKLPRRWHTTAIELAGRRMGAQSSQVVLLEERTNRLGEILSLRLEDRGALRRPHRKGSAHHAGLSSEHQTRTTRLV